MENNLDKLINLNKTIISESLNTNNLEFYYNYVKNIIFDNFVLIIVFYLLILPYIFKSNNISTDKNKQFNWQMLLVIPVVIFIYYFAKIIYRRYSKIGNILRTNECLNIANKIIINKTIKPIYTKKELLTKPFNEFFISTSHNSYIPCTQNIDVASSEAIKYALAMGARVIELDCFAKNNNGSTQDDMTPVVVHGVARKQGDIFTTSYIPFEECIDVISKYGFLTSDPLIVCLELNTNHLLSTQRIMKEIILSKLGNRLLDKSYKIANLTNRKYFTKEPIGNLLNKVMFVTGDGYTSELTGILDGSFGEYEYWSNTDNVDDRLKQSNRPVIVQRIYPTGNLSGHLSYNYDPMPFWKNKYQMVALNFQLVDDNLMKNIAMFKTNSFVHFSELK
jgi:hypothetical protein